MRDGQNLAVNVLTREREIERRRCDLEINDDNALNFDLIQLSVFCLCCAALYTRTIYAALESRVKDIKHFLLQFRIIKFS
jgi:hypothetical protein